MWMGCMKTFADFVRNIRDHNGPTVKIAVIDNGIEASLPIFKDRIALGQSFCRYLNSSELMSAYYVPNGSHGTVMASLICQICPKVKLYIARLEDNLARSGSRRITAKSAAEAITWAVECKVDIISMSWTIETKHEKSLDMVKLRKAIDLAEDNNIVMFCSASDQGNSSGDDCYPGKWEKCIKVGAATGTGELCAWVPAEKIDFLLPGENISVRAAPDQSPKPESGSSVATAVAAGLVGLLLYCNRLVLPEDPVTLKDKLQMEDAFRKMSRGSLQNKFPQVTDFFKPEFKDMVLDFDLEEDSEEARKNLCNLLNRIKEKWFHLKAYGKFSGTVAHGRFGFLAAGIQGYSDRASHVYYLPCTLWI